MVVWGKKLFVVLSSKGTTLLFRGSKIVCQVHIFPGTHKKTLIPMKRNQCLKIIILKDNMFLYKLNPLGMRFKIIQAGKQGLPDEYLHLHG